MKETFAYWEKRNLNLEVLEVEFNKEDSIKDINELKYNKYGYVLAKVPVAKLDIIHKLEGMNFKFIETQFELVNEIEKDRLIKKSKMEILKNSYFKEILYEKELNEILVNVDSKLFETDRIALDPAFNMEIAAFRYKNWIKDEYINKTSAICKIVYNGENAGFFMLKTNEVQAQSLLVGLYNQYKSKGLGILVVDKHLEYCFENKIREVTTRISSNNLKSLNVHLECGYKIKAVNYVFRRII